MPGSRVTERAAEAGHGHGGVAAWARAVHEPDAAADARSVPTAYARVVSATDAGLVSATQPGSVSTAYATAAIHARTA